MILLSNWVQVLSDQSLILWEDKNMICFRAPPHIHHHPQPHQTNTHLLLHPIIHTWDTPESHCSPWLNRFRVCLCVTVPGNRWDYFGRAPLLLIWAEQNGLAQIWLLVCNVIHTPKLDCLSDVLLKPHNRSAEWMESLKSPTVQFHIYRF